MGSRITEVVDLETLVAALNRRDNATDRRLSAFIEYFRALEFPNTTELQVFVNNQEVGIVDQLNFNGGKNIAVGTRRERSGVLGITIENMFDPEEAEPSGFLPVVVIAAADAPEPWVTYAEASPYGFVCDGVADEFEFVEAEQVLGTVLGVIGASRILLSPGNFYLTAGFDGLLPGTLTAAYIGATSRYDPGFVITGSTINITTGWAGLSGSTNPLSVAGQCENIRFVLVPDATPSGTVPNAITFSGQSNNCAIILGSSTSTLGVACEYMAGLGDCYNAYTELYTQSFTPNTAMVQMQDAHSMEFLWAFDGGFSGDMTQFMQVSGRCHNVKAEFANEHGFPAGGGPFLVSGIETSLSQFQLVAPSADWTGVNGVFRVASTLQSSERGVHVDVSSMHIESEDHPTIFYVDPAFDCWPLGSAVLSGSNSQRPPANQAAGMLWVDTAGPTLQWSDGTTWNNL